MPHHKPFPRMAACGEVSNPLLNHSSTIAFNPTTTAGSISNPLSAELRDALNAYGDAARDVANAIGTHAATAEFNRRVNQLNDSKTKAVKVCLAS